MKPRFIRLREKGYRYIFKSNYLEIKEALKDKEHKPIYYFHFGKKQIFYFDDFLGSNFLSIFQSKEDSHIINFMRRVARDKNKRFILTTRTNILSQGKKLSEKLYMFDPKY